MSDFVDVTPRRMKYEIQTDSFIEALERLMGQHLKNDDGKVSSYEMAGEYWSMKLKIKTPPKKKKG